jgi:hypothetical protein
MTEEQLSELKSTEKNAVPGDITVVLRYRCVYEELKGRRKMGLELAHHKRTLLEDEIAFLISVYPHGEFLYPMFVLTTKDVGWVWSMTSREGT